MESANRPWYLSAADGSSRRLVPPLGVVAFALALIAMLAVSFPARDLGVRLQRSQHADALSIAYLRVWLLAEPDDDEVRLALGKQLTIVGDFAGADTQWRILRMSKAATPALRAAIALNELISLEQAYFSIAGDSPKAQASRQEYRLRIHQRLQTALVITDEPTFRQRLLVMAQAFEAHSVAERLLSSSRPVRRGSTEVLSELELAGEESFTPPLDTSPRALANLALRQANYRGAAKVYWQALGESSGAEKRREYFELALRSMQSGNLLKEGLQEAERYLPVIAPDLGLYRWLTKLALQSGQPELAQRYAKLMLQMSWLRHQGISPEGLFDHLKIGKAQNLGFKVASQPATPAEKAKAPFDESAHLLGFEVFLANRNLKDALLVAQTVVKQLPDNMPWRERLAQTAQWSGHAELALEQRVWIARRVPSVSAWQEVQRLAQASYDGKLLLESVTALHKLTKDGVLLLELARLHELVGEPKEAYRLLANKLQDPAASIEHALALLELAHAMGDEAARLRHAQHALEKFGFVPDVAIHQALSHYLQGNERSALLIMRRIATWLKSHPEKKLLDKNKQDIVFWPIYAELARKLGHVPLAIDAYQQLLKAGRIEAGQLAVLVDLLRQGNPEAALQAARDGWKNMRDPTLLQKAFELTLEQHGSAAAKAFASEHDAQNRWSLLDSVVYHSSVAMELQKAGRWEEARPHIEQLLTRDPGSSSVQAAMIWQLLGQRDAVTLKRYLHSWSAQASPGNELSSAFAAAWLSLQEPRKALAYLAKRPDLRQDYLWQFALAEALEQSGEVDMAWALRQRMWRSRPQALQTQVPDDTRKQSLAAVGSLALRFAPADGARQLLLNLATQGETQSLVNELVLASMLSHGHSDNASAWLLARYANQLSQPAWARLSLALGNNDKAQLEQLLTDLPDWLPRADRMSALERLGRDDEALRVAQGFVERNPLDQPMAQRLGSLLLDNASAIQLGTSQFRVGDYRSSQVTSVWQHRLSEHWWLNSRIAQTRHESSDPVFRSYLPARDRSFEFGARWQRGEHDMLAALSARDSVASTSGLLLAHQWQPKGWRLTSSIAFGQPADETILLRAAGSRNFALGSVEHNFSDRLAFSARAQYSSIRLQDGPTLATGWSLGVGSSYSLLLTAPALRINAQLRNTQFSASPGLTQARNDFTLRGLESISGGLLPSSATETSLGLSLGDLSDSRAGEGWMGRWMPIADAALVHNSVIGSSFRFSVGARGSVVGPDQLALLFTRSGATTQQPQPSSLLNLHYRWLY